MKACFRPRRTPRAWSQTRLPGSVSSTMSSGSTSVVLQRCCIDGRCSTRFAGHLPSIQRHRLHGFTGHDAVAALALCPIEGPVAALDQIRHQFAGTQLCHADRHGDAGQFLPARAARDLAFRNVFVESILPQPDSPANPDWEVPLSVLRHHSAPEDTWSRTRSRSTLAIKRRT